MRALILFLAASAMLSAAVTGVVVNKTTGKPQARRLKWWSTTPRLECPKPRPTST